MEMSEIKDNDIKDFGTVGARRESLNIHPVRMFGFLKRNKKHTH
jgi:hypothetical protein